MRTRARRAGFGPVEVLVVVLVVGVLVLLLALVLLSTREESRLVTCRRNLGQIGVAVGLYDQFAGRLPAVPPLGVEEPAGPAPLAGMMELIGVSSFSGLDERWRPPEEAGGPPEAVSERFIAGFVCPADPIATSRVFPAPVNFRANAGTKPDGSDGPFAPGRSLSLAEVEAGDGVSYTAGFAERLVGSAGERDRAGRDYAVVPGPVPPGGCPDAPESALRDDAGRSWAVPGWRSTLYAHARLPGMAPGCIAEDGRTALMGASSGHVEGVHVLMLDGSVRVLTTTVAPAVWEALGSPGDLEAVVEGIGRAAPPLDASGGEAP